MSKGAKTLEKKQTDVKFIVGIVILAVILILMGCSFWKVVALQAERDREEEARIEEMAISAIYVEAGEYLKQPLFVDMDTNAVFTAPIPEEGIHNKKGTLIRDDVLENGDKVKIYGDGAITRSIPGKYPGVTKMQRIGRASLEETDEYLKLVNEMF